ncbi:hypothetical protein FRB99_005856 [Tulasnella sp. 403]|nr:hypothetical protein FRB99_005856 [Tulasnella sp. 403]
MDVAFTATAYLNRHAEIHAAKAQKAAQALWEEGSRAFLQRHPESPPDQFAGRSVQVPEGPNGFTRAYRKLNQILMENRVRKMVKRQSRHEKKGVKRRRLASETHRRKFAQLVRSKVALVQRIRARGS